MPSNGKNRTLSTASRASVRYNFILCYNAIIPGIDDMDKEILQNCVNESFRGWENFVDRFMGLIIHIIDHTIDIRRIDISSEEREKLCERVFQVFKHDNYRILRQYRERASISSYLTVVARRIVVRNLTNEL